MSDICVNFRSIVNFRYLLIWLYYAICDPIRTDRTLVSTTFEDLNRTVTKEVAYQQIG